MQPRVYSFYVINSNSTAISSASFEKGPGNFLKDGDWTMIILRLLASCMRRFIIFKLLFCKAYSELVVPIYTESEDWEWSCFYTRIPVFSATLTCHFDTDRSYNQVRGLWQRNAGSDTGVNGSELQSSQCWLLVLWVSCVASVSCHFLEHKLTNQRAAPNLFLMDHFGLAQIHTHTRQFIEISPTSKAC